MITAAAAFDYPCNPELGTKIAQLWRSYRYEWRGERVLSLEIFRQRRLVLGRLLLQAQLDVEQDPSVSSFSSWLRRCGITHSFAYKALAEALCADRTTSSDAVSSNNDAPPRGTTRTTMPSQHRLYKNALFVPLDPRQKYIFNQSMQAHQRSGTPTGSPRGLQTHILDALRAHLTLLRQQKGQ